MEGPAWNGLREITVTDMYCYEAGARHKDFDLLPASRRMVQPARLDLNPESASRHCLMDGHSGIPATAIVHRMVIPMWKMINRAIVLLFSNMKSGLKKEPAGQTMTNLRKHLFYS